MKDFLLASVAVICADTPKSAGRCKQSKIIILLLILHVDSYFGRRVATFHLS